MHRPDPTDSHRDFGRNLTYGMLEAVGRDIVIGAYDGVRFPTEGELMLAHGVSRSVTREAVKMLTAKGLLSARPRQGTSIRPTRAWNLFDPDVLRWLLERKFSLDLLRHFSELRLAIEPAAARLAADSDEGSSNGAIASAFARMVAADDGRDDALDADIAFHVAILHASRNPFFIQFESVVETALRVSIRFTNRYKGRSGSLEAHNAVLKAICAHDDVRAACSMQAILGDVLDLISKAERQDKSAGCCQSNGA